MFILICQTQVFQILPGLYLGSQLGASKLTVIELCDISLVLNLTSTCHRDRTSTHIDTPSKPSTCCAALPELTRFYII